MTPKRIHHGIFFVLLAVAAATGTPLRRIHENQKSSSDHSHFDKSECAPRSHNFDPSTTPENPAPDRFRVQLTLTTTTTTESPTTTKLSTLMIQFNRSWSPIGVDRFYQLVLDHYFDCAVFFRVVPGFIIQFGIASEPEQSTKWDTSVPDDPLYVQSNIRGTVSFATAGPGTRTTQLFINTNDNPSLDRMGFTPIGIIIATTPEEDAMETVVPYIAKPNTKAGEDGINQGKYMEYGNHWLFQHYPEVDLIINTTLITTMDEGNDNNVETNLDLGDEIADEHVDLIGRISPNDHDSPPPQRHRFRNRQHDNDANHNKNKNDRHLK